MSAQLKINVSTTPVSLKEMSGTDYNFTTEVILLNFASSDTGVGTVSVNPANTTGLTSIGTFTDTYRNFAVGTHPVANTITTANTYTFYQDLQSASESLTIPVEFSSGSVRQQNTASLNADSINTALANLVANGIGSYALTTSAPAGGTWTSKYTIVDTVNPTTSANTYLWRKTAGASTPSTVRPVKLDTTTSPSSLKEMSNTEIESLTARLRNQIVTTGVGKYSVQQSAPVGGTWVSQGTAFSDTRNSVSNVNYSGNYSGTYTLFYAGFVGGNFTGTYTGTYAGATVNATTESVSTVSLWLRIA